jgi:hypothetical protein
MEHPRVQPVVQAHVIHKNPYNLQVDPLPADAVEPPIGM